MTSETRKLVFNDQRALQLVLGSPSESKRVVAELERATGVSLHLRGSEVTLDGDAQNFELVERLLQQMFGLARGGRPMMPTDVVRGIEILRQDPTAELTSVYDDVIMMKGNGKMIAPRSLAQKRYVDAMRRNPLVFGVGPAGTGKTFLAVAMAVRRLQDKQVRRIILSRPAVEAGENLGFLPGTLEEKVSPYMRPLYDGLYDMLDGPKVQRMIEAGVIEIAPLAYHARPHAQRRVRDPRRGAEHHARADEDAAHAHRHGHLDGGHRRSPRSVTSTTARAAGSTMRSESCRASPRCRSASSPATT